MFKVDALNVEIDLKARISVGSSARRGRWVHCVTVVCDEALFSRLFTNGGMNRGMNQSIKSLGRAGRKKFSISFVD